MSEKTCRTCGGPIKPLAELRASHVGHGCDSDNHVLELQTGREPSELPMSTNEIPRRAYLNKMTPAERAIYDAVQVVEEVGADVRLTHAVVLLGMARDYVADYVDRVASPARSFNGTPVGATGCLHDSWPWYGKWPWDDSKQAYCCDRCGVPLLDRNGYAVNKEARDVLAARLQATLSR